MGGGRRRPARRRRFACARHLVELCPCPASEYTYFTRKSASELMEAARGLSTLEERLEAWVQEAQRVIDIASGQRRGVIAEAVKAGGEDAGEGGVVVKDEAPAGATTSAAAAAGLGASVKSETEGGGKVKTTPVHTKTKHESESCGSSSHASQAGSSCSPVPHGQRSPSPSSPSPSPASLIPPWWHDRPTVKHLTELMRAGLELGGGEEILGDLKILADGCARWVRAADHMLASTPQGPSSTASAPNDGGTGATASCGRKRSASGPGRGDEGAGVGGVNGGTGVGEGQKGSRGRVGRSPKPREPVAFHKAVGLLQKEAGLPARPVEKTRGLCCALLVACRLRELVRSLLGLGEDEVRRVGGLALAGLPCPAACPLPWRLVCLRVCGACAFGRVAVCWSLGSLCGLCCAGYGLWARLWGSSGVKGLAEAGSEGGKERGRGGRSASRGREGTRLG